MAVPLAPDRGLGRWAFAVGPFLLVLLVIVCVGRARVRGWSAERRAITALGLVGMAGFVAAGAVVAGVGGALVGGFLAWALWHALTRERARRA
jgi:hypothetical protein